MPQVILDPNRNNKQRHSLDLSLQVPPDGDKPQSRRSRCSVTGYSFLSPILEVRLTRTAQSITETRYRDHGGLKLAVYALHLRNMAPHRTLHTI